MLKTILYRNVTATLASTKTRLEIVGKLLDLDIVVNRNVMATLASIKIVEVYSSLMIVIQRMNKIKI